MHVGKVTKNLRRKSAWNWNMNIKVKIMREIRKNLRQGQRKWDKSMAGSDYSSCDYLTKSFPTAKMIKSRFFPYFPWRNHFLAIVMNTFHRFSFYDVIKSKKCLVCLLHLNFRTNYRIRSANNKKFHQYSLMGNLWKRLIKLFFFRSFLKIHRYYALLLYLYMVVFLFLWCYNYK